jgi:hypothetical protein
MRFLKLIAISVIVLFIIATLVGLLFPSKVLVSRAIDIQQPAATILAAINNFQTWQFWIEGANDTTFQLINSNSIMLGKTKVVKDSSTASSVFTTWYVANGAKQKSSINIIASGNNASIVQWQFEQQLSWYPWERFASMLSDKIIGTMMEKNLQLLQQYSSP